MRDFGARALDARTPSCSPAIIVSLVVCWHRLADRAHVALVPVRVGVPVVGKTIGIMSGQHLVAMVYADESVAS